MEEIVEKLKDVIVQENDKLRQELKETINQENNKLREEINQNMNDLRKEILDRQFVFEDEYGTKIDAIFEYVQFHQKNNLKRFDRIEHLEERLEVMEVHNFDHEKRISNLERKKG